MADAKVSLMLADVDGTLVTQEKVLTTRAVEAVHALHEAGILFAVTSGRPPMGMAMLIAPLDIQSPISAFNGGVIVDGDMKVLEERLIPDGIVLDVVDLMKSFELSVWIYIGADWYVPDPKGPRRPRSLDREIPAEGHDEHGKSDPRRVEDRRRE